MPSKRRRRSWKSIEGRTPIGCEYCGQPDDGSVRFEWDHIIPLALGGYDRPDNLAYACKPCNRRKADNRGWKTRDGRMGTGYAYFVKDGVLWIDSKKLGL